MKSSNEPEKHRDLGMLLSIVLVVGLLFTVAQSVLLGNAVQNVKTVTKDVQKEVSKLPDVIYLGEKCKCNKQGGCKCCHCEKEDK